MKKKSSDFFKRIRIKYKLSVLNESTLEEVYHFRLSTLSLFALAMSVSLLSFILFSTLILNTPLKRLLPENTDNHVRNEVLRNSMKIDSLSQELQKKQEYIDVIRDIVAGNINIDSSYSADIVVAKKIQEKFIEKSKAEKDFCDEFESEEKYNLVNLTTNQNTDLLFFRPVKGIITQKFNSRNTDNFGINISVDQNTTVFLPLFSLTLFTANILAFKDFTSRDWSFFTILVLPASLAFTIRFCNIFTDCSTTSKSTANQFMWVISFLQDSITLYLSILKIYYYKCH